MRTIFKNPLMLIFRIAFWVILGLTWNTVNAQSLTLKDTKGREVVIRPVNVTETEVVGIRSRDQKEVKIPLHTLDSESVNAVLSWKKLTGRLPTKEFICKISKKIDDTERKYTVKFKMPEMAYNTKFDKTRISLIFDATNNAQSSGEFYINVSFDDRKQTDVLADILSNLNENLKRKLENMSPSERQIKEPLMKLSKFTHGEFKGYITPSDKKNQVRVITTNGKYSITASLEPYPYSKSDSVLSISPEDVFRILETLVVVNGH
jgi:hypothetical protein